MTVNNKNSSVPKLRFKEFKGDWQVKKLGDVCEKKSSSISANSITNNNGEYKIYGASGFLKKIDFYTQEKPYIAIIKDGSGVGRTLLCDKKSSVIGTLDIIKNKDKNVLKFILETINKISFNKYIVGGAIPHIYFKDYSKESIFSPNSKEQQKIADCLTSLDDLITAQDKKLQNLKTHKKGLMQKLFPATNQTTPQLRFTEFSGDWQVKKLGDILDYEQPTKYLVASSKYSDKYTTPVLTAGKTFLLGYTNETNGIFKNNLPVIIFDDFTTAFKFVNFPFKAKSSAMKMLVIKNECENIKFIYESMGNIKFQPKTHKRYWISEYQNNEIPYPKPKEQQKIADCLTSLDDLITAQANKITTLKIHKKGLMQQLFPDNNKDMI
jgi:type I restriction enzyme S subunit